MATDPVQELLADVETLRTTGRSEEALQLLKYAVADWDDPEMKFIAAHGVVWLIVDECGGEPPHPASEEYRQLYEYVRIALDSFNRADPSTQRAIRESFDVDALREIAKGQPDRRVSSMIIAPVFNKRSLGYGGIDNPELWRRLRSYLEERGIEPYNEGAYSSVIDAGLSHVAVTLKSCKKKGLEEGLSLMDEVTLAWFYLMGMSYARLGQADEAIAMLKMTLSQQQFEGLMLPEFRGYPGKALAALAAIAEKRGEAYVNGFDVANYVANWKIGGGCFVATAACGTEEAPDVLLLRAFRDAVLFPSRLGRAFVAIYYSLSPPVARIIAKSSLLRLSVRALFIKPTAYLCRIILQNGSSGQDEMTTPT